MIVWVELFEFYSTDSELGQTFRFYSGNGRERKTVESGKVRAKWTDKINKANLADFPAACGKKSDFKKNWRNDFKEDKISIFLDSVGFIR